MSRNSSSRRFQSTRPSRGETQVYRPGRGVGVISIHSPLAGRDRSCRRRSIVCRRISIHSPLAGRDTARSASPRTVSDFNPLAPRGARHVVDVQGPALHEFQSTRPSRGETPRRRGPPRRASGFQSTRPSRGETGPERHHHGQDEISIHSPLAGRDPDDAEDDTEGGISIHSPLAGRDTSASSPARYGSNFNPLAPRGARPGRRWSGGTTFYFNPLAPRGARLETITSTGYAADFNPLAPRGARRQPPERTAAPSGFQSTRPSRGETRCRAISAGTVLISIHSPLAGRDMRLAVALVGSGYFNPLAPRGARPWPVQKFTPSISISIHSPLAGRDHVPPAVFVSKRISIHSPLAGRDEHQGQSGDGQEDFNPLAPRGARRRRTRAGSFPSDFNPLAPRGARHGASEQSGFRGYFNPLAPRGARREY